MTARYHSQLEDVDPARCRIGSRWIEQSLARCWDSSGGRVLVSVARGVADSPASDSSEHKAQNLAVGQRTSPANCMILPL